ncbi:MAG: aryl-sulfate sulfotransferase [Candidatus Heimdallarchaeota archaeon]|nr:MAG: aryl-sulfate sulfotransferase [Candidatus Heimdallarchaeota archaeon]
MFNRDPIHSLFICLTLISIFSLAITNVNLIPSINTLNSFELDEVDDFSQSQQLLLEKSHLGKMSVKKNIINQNSKTMIPILEGVEANITFSGDYFEGYNLFELTDRQSDADKKKRLLIISTEGEVFAELQDHQHPTKFLTPDTILCAKDIGNREANAVLWNIQDNTTQILDFYGHHDFEWNHNNDTCFAFVKYLIEIDGQEYEYDTIDEYNLAGELVWSLDTRSFIHHTQWCVFKDMVGDAADLVHSNTIFFDNEEDVFYYNPRNLNTFYKIDHSTGEVLWGLGEYGNFTLFDLNGKRKDSLFYHPHALEKVDENTFIIFDNNLHNKTGNINARSRMLEITINERTMTANESWMWIAPREYYTAVLCDADRLPNGNRLGTFGMDSHPNTNIGARIVEVNDTGHIVWEMNFPRNEGISYRVYQVDRFRFAPILNPTPDIRYDDNDLIVTWQTWYNFRSNRQITEPYTIYLDDEPVYNGEHTFEKFWRPTNLTVNLGNLEIGTHHISVVFTDLNDTLEIITVIDESISGFDLFLITGFLFTMSTWSLIHRKRDPK